MTLLRKHSLVALLITSLFCFMQTANAVQIDKIVVFGDSLSDNGNILSLTSKAHKVFPSVPVIPKNPPYFEGRFSNGLIWIDNLAANLNVPLSDYAYGGSWAEPLHDSNLYVPFGLGMQVNYYLVLGVTDFHKDQHLFVIWAGGNDYVSGREDAEYATTNTVASIESQIDWLIYYKAKNVLVMNLPDLSLVPEVTAKGPEAMAAVKKLVTLHNKKLAKMLAEMQMKYPDTKIILGDVMDYFTDAYAHPEKYNLKNVSSPCYTGDYSMKSLLSDRTAIREIAAAKEQNIDIMNSPSLRIAYMAGRHAEDGGEVCATPDNYMFWDQIHPSRVVHAYMALHAAEILADNDIQGQDPAK